MCIPKPTLYRILPDRLYITINSHNDYSHPGFIYVKNLIATGAGSQNRTDDLRFTRALLYLLSYSSMAPERVDLTGNDTASIHLHYYLPHSFSGVQK